MESLADEMNVEYRLATAGVESKNIDGYIGTQPVSIKPKKNAAKDGQLSPIQIGVPLILYHNTSTYIHIFFDRDVRDVNGL